MPVPTLRPQKTTMVIIKTWGGRCLVSLPLLNLSEKYLACNATPGKAPPQKTQQRPPDRQTRQREKPEKHPRERRRKEKKTRRGGNLGEEEHEDERVEGEVHVRDEETQGESQTPEKGFGFPQRLRKKERKRERERERTASTKPTKQPEKKERTTNTKANKGAGLKGHQSKHHTNSRDKTPNKTTKNIPEQPNKETSTNPTSLGGLHTAGWRGPWAALHLLRRHPRGPWYRGVRGPPHHGNRPRWRKNKHHVRQVTCTPESWARLLAGPYRLKRPLSQSIQEANSTAIINRTDS